MNLRWFREHGISVVEFLRNADILSGLERNTLKALARVFIPVTAKAGETVMRQGEPGDALYLVASGRLRAERARSDGTTAVLGEICTGEVAGEAALLTDEPRFATLTAVEETHLLRLSRIHFQDVLEKHPEEIRQLSALIARRHEQGRQQRYRPVSRNLIEFLQSVPLFAFLPPALLHEIEPHLTWIHLPAGRELMHQGDEADGLFVVVGGRLRYETRDHQDRIVREGDFGRGEIIGELALLTGDNRSATVRAMRDSELVKLSSVSVQRLLHEAPHAVFWLTRIIAERLQRDDRATPGRSFSVLTVIPVSPGLDARSFCEDLKTALSSFGTVELMTPDRVDSQFGKGTSSLDLDDPRQSEFMVWLSDREQEVDFLILAGSPDSMPWNERCLRQADRILLVADAQRDWKLSPVEVKYPPGSNISAERTLVLLQPEGAKRAENTTAFLKLREGMRYAHVRKKTPADMQRLARILTGNSVGLVLGGGGARGIAHIGVIAALLDNNVPIDMIGGTSAGAIMGGAFAYFQEVETVKQMVKRYMVDQNPLNDYTFPFLSVARGRRYSGALEEIFGQALIEDLLTPVFAIACSLTNSREETLKSGLLWAAMRGSSSLPGIAPPLYMNGELFVDGGLMNNVPVDVMQNLGAGRTIAIDVSSGSDNEDSEYGEFMDSHLAAVGPSFFKVLANKLRPASRRKKLPTLAGILVRSTTIGSTARMAETRKQADVFARLPLDGYSLLDWKAMDQFIEIGYRFACENMAIWKEKLGIKAG